MEYLVLLRPGDDDAGCFRNSLQQIITEEGSLALNGNVHVTWNGDICDCCAKEFKVEGILYAHELYVKLPKEQIYVRAEAWEHEYIKSQVQELVYIFRCIGGNVIDITVDQKNSDSSGENAGVYMGLADYGVSLGGRVERCQRTKNTIRSHLVFPTSKYYKTEKELFKDPFIFYLQYKPDWQNVIEERLAGQASSIEFEFLHFNELSVHRGFIIKANRLGIRIMLDNNDSNHLKMKFKVTFVDHTDVNIFSDEY